VLLVILVEGQILLLIMQKDSDEEKKLSGTMKYFKVSGIVGDSGGRSNFRFVSTNRFSRRNNEVFQNIS
jgi:hypothetical protein